MNDRILLTAAGAVRLREELKTLKSVRRPEIIAAIAEARAHGDLSENAEYAAAREQQGFIEGRIKDLENQLSQAEIIDISTLNVKDKIVFGAYVTLFDEHNDVEVRYQIVGNLEADIEAARISISSPIGRALIGKRVGDEFHYEAPGGERTYEVLSVSYEEP